MKPARRTVLKGIAAGGLTLAMPAIARATTVVRVAISARDLGSLDPAFGIGNGDEVPIRQIFNTLVSPPDGTLKVRPSEIRGELAEHWEMAPDGMAWTFRLRPGVKWHKGFGEVTSEDVAFTLRRMGDRKTGSQYSANYRQIASIETPDPLTVIVRFSEPAPFFYAIALMPRYGGYIQCKKAFEALGDKYALGPVGSGAYEFVSYSYCVIYPVFCVSAVIVHSMGNAAKLSAGCARGGYAASRWSLACVAASAAGEPRGR